MDYKTARNELAKEIAATLTLLTATSYTLSSIPDSSSDVMFAVTAYAVAGLWSLLRTWDAMVALKSGETLYAFSPPHSREEPMPVPMFHIPKGDAHQIMQRAMRLQGEYAFRASMSEELQATYDALPPEQHFQAALREALALYHEGKLHVQSSSQP